MVDLFEEVEGELRSDWYKRLLRQWGPWLTVILAAVLIGYLGYWGFRFYQDRNLAKATIEYQAGVDAVAQSKGAATALPHFQAAVQAGVPAYRSLALIQEGNLRAAAGKPDEAAALYDEAARRAPNQIFADLATLKAAEVLLGTVAYPQIQARLAPLTDPKRPYSVYAKETLAMAKLAAGRTADARHDFSRLSITLGAPDGVRQRAEAAIELIDSGEVGVAVAAAKIAATLPPPPAPTQPQPSSAGGPDGPPPSSTGAPQ